MNERWEIPDLRRSLAAVRDLQRATNDMECDLAHIANAWNNLDWPTRRRLGRIQRLARLTEHLARVSGKWSPGGPPIGASDFPPDHSPENDDRYDLTDDDRVEGSP